ncbi:TolC family protein [Synechococcus sp. CS-602]|uniref:TolC family protein n=2 Tax=Synechococcaceae TaxID=1890426 RepID=UPI0008FF3BD7|nr:MULTISPECIES: TolC family protein [unclassified Synechococcus]APD47600.1 RND transporter [Synechococcus sp. SynAce01]MCT0201597.1 TolC family protein [Synechococcus sp. CS-603]MCT0204212.1 TolC family protein [Synechococcus sp. CS-602]MCT0245427.1 TolC family protein [Synechococcus sp. CS-601]TWB90346.1 OMF family outer membrane factor [Synechococcus sp. Ace-Pa]
MALVPAVARPGWSQEAEAPAQDPPAQEAVVPQSTGIPLAPEVVGERPLADPSVLAPAATELSPALQPLAAPPALALPITPNQVRIQELRPLGLSDVETLAEVNNPNLKAVASQMDQAKSNLRAQISAWYPNINLSTSNSFPGLSNNYRFQSSSDGSFSNPGATTGLRFGAQMNIGINWDLINPQRVPQIARARDQFEQAQNQYLIALRDLRLQVAQSYFDLQLSDENVRIGQESVRASLVSLRDARARFQAGVSTKLEVLQAETQLARDQQLLTTALADQSVARRTLASFLDLPQDVTPTAKEPARVLASWLPSLQESIVAAYAFREELDQIILDISISNSSANVSIGAVQPFLSIVNNFGWNRFNGQTNVPAGQSIDTSIFTYNFDNAIGLNLSWSLFDGGRAAAEYRQQKQAAEESRFRFASRRDSIRQEVETSFYELLKNNRDIATTSREVISSREALRLARLRFQAGVTTQREVVDSQRDLTNAEVRYARSVTDYNRRLAELRRRTGLDQLALCKPPVLPSVKPQADPTTQIPIEPLPLQSACQADSIL